MSALLQKKKLSPSKNNDTLFDVELQSLPSAPSSVPTTAPANPFNNFPTASPISSQPVFYPLHQQQNSVASVPPVVALNSSYTQYIPQQQVLNPQTLQPQNPNVLISPQYYMPQTQILQPQYLPQVLPAYNQPYYPGQTFSSSVLARVDQPNTAQFPLYPVIEQHIQPSAPTINYPDIGQIFKNDKETSAPITSKETHSREKIKSSKERKEIGDETLDQTITKRCKRCTAYYVENELEQAENKTPCKYHPGSFKTGYSSTLIAGARLQYWTCCKSSNKNDPGCKAGKHIEDPQMTSVQIRNPTQPPQAQVGVLIDFAPPVAEQPQEKKEKESTKPEKPRNLIRHYVTDADTLIGIAFRYHVTPQAIRQLNRMANDDVQGYSKLYIPRKGHQVNLSELESDSEEEADGPPQNLSESERQLFEKRMLMKLRAQTGISNEEASYYLTMYGWSFSSALKEYQEDLEWEKNNKRVPSRKCK